MNCTHGHVQSRRKTLAADLVLWKGANLSMAQFKLLDKKGIANAYASTLKAVLIYNNTIYWPFRNPRNADKRVCPRPCEGTVSQSVGGWFGLGWVGLGWVG